MPRRAAGSACIWSGEIFDVEFFAGKRRRRSLDVEFFAEKKRRRSLSAALLRSSVLRKAFQNVNATFSVRYVRSMRFTEKFPSLPTRSPTRPKRRTRTKTKKKKKRNPKGCRHRRPAYRFPYRRERPPRWPLY